MPLRPIAPLTLCPHPAQPRIIDFHIVIDTKVGLALAAAVKAAGILLERSLPGDRQGQDEGVEAGMIEALADQFTMATTILGWSSGTA